MKIDKDQPILNTYYINLAQYSTPYNPSPKPEIATERNPEKIVVKTEQSPHNRVHQVCCDAPQSFHAYHHKNGSINRLMPSHQGSIINY